MTSVAMCSSWRDVGEEEDGLARFSKGRREVFSLHDDELLLKADRRPTALLLALAMKYKTVGRANNGRSTGLYTNTIH